MSNIESRISFSFIDFSLVEVSRIRKDSEPVSNQGANSTSRVRRESDRVRNEVLVVPDANNLRNATNQPVHREVKQNKNQFQ